MDSLPFRVACSWAVDGSLSVLCGLLLARHWLRLSSRPTRRYSLALPALTLCVGTLLQLLSLTVVFTGQSSLRAIVAALPDILSTHAGHVLGLCLAAALLLLALVSVPLPTRLGFTASSLLLLVCIVLRSGVGHAATEQVVTLLQMLQFLHLAGMSVWSGGIIVSALLVLPRLATAPQPSNQFPSYLTSLSQTSTWAVATVFASGLIKGYQAINGDFHALSATSWTVTLAIKLVCVLAALSLGALNRRLLHRTKLWSASARRTSVVALRAEAAVMIVILLLSGLLANNPPPGM